MVRTSSKESHTHTSTLLDGCLRQVDTLASYADFKAWGHCLKRQLSQFANLEVANGKSDDLAVFLLYTPERKFSKKVDYSQRK